jgi:thiamine-phosphate pyrophosphorylase
VSLRPESPIIYLITKGEATDSNLAGAVREILEIIRVAVDEKVSLVQIREKHLSARSLFELTAATAEITRHSTTRLLVNDRADIALAAGADGVHLAGNSLPADVIREAFPSGFIIGVSTHSLAESVDASDRGADFAVFGPVFESPGKGEPQGLGALSRVCSELRAFPVIGLGGIDGANCESVTGAGAAGIAAIRALNEAESLRSVAARLRQ